MRLQCDGKWMGPVLRTSGLFVLTLLTPLVCERAYGQAAITIERSVSIQPSIRLLPFSGQDQFADTGSNLSEDLVVQAIRPDGAPVSGIEVFFEIVEVPFDATGTALLADQDITDSSGLARTQLTLGNSQGIYRVRFASLAAR